MNKCEQNQKFFKGDANNQSFQAFLKQNSYTFFGSQHLICSILIFPNKFCWASCESFLLLMEERRVRFLTKKLFSVAAHYLLLGSSRRWPILLSHEKGVPGHFYAFHNMWTKLSSNHQDVKNKGWCKATDTESLQAFSSSQATKQLNKFKIKDL